MTAAYPAELPRPQRDGCGYDLTPPLAMSPNERGLGRVRRIGSVNQVRMQLTWIFDRSQLTVFASWWRTTIACGTLPFTIKLLNGCDDADQEVIATDAYEYEPAGGRWMVRLPIDIPNMTVATQAQMQEAIDNFADLTQADALHQAVHFTLPEAITGAA